MFLEIAARSLTIDQWLPAIIALVEATAGMILFTTPVIDFYKQTVT